MSYFQNSTSSGNGNYEYSVTSTASNAPNTQNSTSSYSGNLLLVAGIVFTGFIAYYMLTGDSKTSSNNAQSKEKSSIIDYLFVKKPDTIPVAQLHMMTESEKKVHEKRIIYIEKYKRIAIEEQKKFGILSSITLAQGILESGAGTSSLVRSTNNHFGMKCFSKSCTKGHCKNFNDDSHKDFFLCFGGDWASFRAHSKLLSNNNYRQCKECNDYKEYAKCLKKQNYATLPSYAEGLIRIIDLYQLWKLDQIAK
jgi:flagellum-specific peptidoglycan hydrolase FlgJ